MSKSNKKTWLTSFLAILLLISSFSITYAENDDLNFLTYFGTDTCVSCQNVVRKMDKLIEKHDLTINIDKYDITRDGGEDLLTKYAFSYGIAEEDMRTIPAIFIGEIGLIGEQEILENLEDTLLEHERNPQKQLEIVDNVLFGGMAFSAASVFIGGLLDGINPCAISMMLFFISFSMMNNQKKKIIPIGLLFCLGTFIAYFGLGLGLLTFIYQIQSISSFAIVFYGLLVGATTFLAILNIKDYIAIKQGKYENIKNQLSSGMKSRIHSFIKKRLLNDKVIYISAFVTGFVISLLEFFCTGQIYLPMITYMISLDLDVTTNYTLLALYNFAFIIPLLTITFALYFGRNVVDISQLMLDKLSIIKLTGALFFLTAAIFTLTQLLKFI